MENRSTTLVLCAALASASRRPLQIRDLQVYVRLASHDKGVPSWVRQVAWHDASGIFTILHDLEATGQVRRENKGYVLTRPGRVCADNLLRELPPAEAEALNRVAADAARTAA